MYRCIFFSNSPANDRWRVGGDSFLVRVFAATDREMALQSVCLIFEKENKGGKQNVKINNVYVEIKKVKMNYSSGHVSWSILMVNIYVYLHSS